MAADHRVDGPLHGLVEARGANTHPTVVRGAHVGMRSEGHVDKTGVE